MKKVFLSLMVFTLSLNLFAMSDDNVKVQLSFDKNYDSTQVDSKYLKVVQENWRFPSSTTTGKAQKKKFVAALNLLEEVLNSEEFKQKVLANETVLGMDDQGNEIKERRFGKNYLWRDSQNLLSNEDIYQIIMDGNEKMRPGTEGEMNFNSWVKVCKWYQKAGTWCRKVIGSTDPSNSKWIKLNWKYYSYFDTPKMINNMTHEWLHLLGFLHGPAATMRQEVPYVVGKIAEDVARSIIAKDKE